MSALPEEALHPRQTSSYLTAINERTDDCILTDDELYQLKGGNAHIATKAAVGFGFVFAYLLASRKISEFTKLSVTGPTFLKANLMFILGCNTFGFISSVSYRTRLVAHRSALLRRFMLNNAYMARFKKAPKVQ